MSLLASLLIILLLILANGLFVAAEFAIIGVRHTRIEQLVGGGSRRARWVQDTLEHSRKTDRYIATAQLGITLASLGLGMYGEPVIAHVIEGPLHDWFGLEGGIVHTISFVVALTLITYLHVVLGEMVPKSLALQNAEGTVLLLTAPMRLMERIFSIPVTLLNQIGLALLRLLRVRPPQETSRIYSPEELELIVSESHAVGLLAEHEQALVANILEFSEERVVQVMTPRTSMTSIPVGIAEADLLELVAASRHSRFPVYEGKLDNMLGVLHIKDLVRQQLSGKPFDLRALLRQMLYVPETASVPDLLATFKKRHQHLAIVLDEYGGTLGVVTLEDLLEEVVGEVRDEFDADEEDPLSLVAPGHLRALGTAPVKDVETHVYLGSSEPGVQTVGGLILAKLGRMPVVGDQVLAGDATLHADEVEGLTIKRVSIHFSPKSEPSP